MDALFAQIALGIVFAEFDDVSGLLDLLSRKLRSIGADEASTCHSMAYALDQVADWQSMTDLLRVEFHYHTGPDAPHHYKFVHRSDLPHELGQDFGQLPIEDLPAASCRPGDVFLLTKHYMASNHFHQASFVLSEAWNAAVPDQPCGNRPRKPKDAQLVRDIVASSRRAAAQNLITPEARGFPEGWATESLPEAPRPARYRYLNHRWRQPVEPDARVKMFYDGMSAAVHRVRIHTAGPDAHADTAEVAAEQEALVPLVAIEAP